MFKTLSARIESLSRRGGEWAERQDPASPSGVAISAWRHYRAIDAPLQSALLSLYMLVAVLPAVLVMDEYLDPHPDSLANSLVHHFHLNAPTATLIHGVLDEGKAHELGSALLAVAGALFFGLGFGRVLQLVHARSWQLALPTRQTEPGSLRGGAHRNVRPDPVAARPGERAERQSKVGRSHPRARLGRVPGAVLRLGAVAADPQADQTT
jgi:hypothetical protein